MSMAARRWRRRWTGNSTGTSSRHFAARPPYQARGVKVYNLSEASRLGPDVFEKRHWRCLLPPGTATGTFAESDR